MKHIKKYEVNNITPKVGDYVICYEMERISSVDDYKQFVSFIDSNIGIIVYKEKAEPKYKVQYFNVPPELELYFGVNYNSDTRYMYSYEILHFSSSREEMKLKLMSTKYNL